MLTLRHVIRLILDFPTQDPTRIHPDSTHAIPLKLASRRVIPQPPHPSFFLPTAPFPPSPFCGYPSFRLTALSTSNHDAAGTSS